MRPALMIRSKCVLCGCTIDLCKPGDGKAAESEFRQRQD